MELEENSTEIEKHLNVIDVLFMQFKKLEVYPHIQIKLRILYMNTFRSCFYVQFFFQLQNMVKNENSRVDVFYPCLVFRR